MTRGARTALAVAALLAVAAPGAAAATPNACSAGTARMWELREAHRAGEWPSPLDRVVSFDLGDVTLGRALALVSSNTGVRVSYSPDLVPVQRGVCLSVAGKPLGEILVTLLAGTAVAPVIVGADQVVLAPSRSAAGAQATPVSARGTGVLERVVVTGTATGAPERASPLGISTVDRVALQAPANVSLASVLDAAVPGLWMWSQSPSSALARYGSIRGASSFGVSTPKIYIDGIEVANPLLLTSLDPDQLERIEVIRGPQGAALYGADAISGVVNIQTRHDGADEGGRVTNARVSVGGAQSDFADASVLAQEHGVTTRSGSAARSASFGLSASTLGPFTPGSSARQLLASASARHVGSRAILLGTARFEGTNADAPVSPIVRGYLASPLAASDSATQRVRQYTVGGTATFQASEAWTHAATIGIDGYRLSGVAGEATPLPSVADSALHAARGGADRITLRLSSTRDLGSEAFAGSQVTMGLEHSTARERSSGIGGTLAPRPDGQGPVDSAAVMRGMLAPGFAPALSTAWWNNTGAFTQGTLALARAVFVTGGARLERISGPSDDGRFTVLPMLGASWVNDGGPWTLKLRGAYGRGIRPARTVARGATFTGGHGYGTLTSLAPEQQSGVEAGVDALRGQLFGLHVTRFGQRASGLVQPVAILATTRRHPGEPETSRVLYQLQNVGAIDNSGWEMQATSAVGPLGLGATMTLVDSRVARLASGYLGDLREGDRMLEVPARTVGLQARWTASRWSANGSLARAFDWVNYDQVALAQAVAADPAGRLTPVGPALRAYWRDYQGATRLALGSTMRLDARMALTLTGTNLLNQQVGEPDNVTVVPGRTIIVGLRSTF